MTPTLSSLVTPEVLASWQFHGWLPRCRQWHKVGILTIQGLATLMPLVSTQLASCFQCVITTFDNVAAAQTITDTHLSALRRWQYHLKRLSLNLVCYITYIYSVWRYIFCIQTVCRCVIVVNIYHFMKMFISELWAPCILFIKSVRQSCRCHRTSQKYTYIYIDKTTFCCSNFKDNIIPMNTPFAKMCCLLHMMDFAVDRNYVYGFSGLKCGSFQSHMRPRDHLYIFWAKLFMAKDGQSKRNQHY